MSSPPLDTRRLLRESAPVAVILVFWLFLAGIVRPIIANGLLRAGAVMALLYVIVRGLAIARSLPPAPQPDELREILRENVRVAIPSGIWFLGAVIVYEIEQFWNTSGLPGLFVSPADGIAFVLTGAGVAVILIYAIAVGVSRVRGQSFDRPAGADVPPADD